jgi:cold shock CspA family protein
MFYGIVQNLNRERGFGFIRQEGRPDVYFHATVVEEAAFDRILPDQAVMFDLAKRDPDAADDRGPQAAKVKLIARIPGGILPPPTQALAPKHHPKARQRKPTWRNKPQSEGS